ncbi:kinesin-like protein KIF21A isoform X2 [Contarinia nasturtii]|uniref:kinesin-like protein KIF21A isoform X2 n=1 Tax=Contarinia nasturtii TaxID=265458 RepID=UPI0012D4A62F|nr:kinesin-like protein KIF21A isoform X2 [Contarinia nasturtii]
MAEDDMDCCVRVAVRIRPQIPREIIDMCRICTQVTPNEPQIILGADKAFTYDFVFDVNSTQSDIYQECVERLVDGAMKGYNATVLAYGQTGSGKTFTMGTGFETETHEDQEGIIPRAVRHLFSSIGNLKENPYDENGVCMDMLQFSVGAQFMELYNEEIIDLLDPYNKTKQYKITSDSAGAINVPDATIKPIHGPQDAMRCLQQGALARTTASTQMNAQSSRSHAIFTILIKRQRRISGEENNLMEDDLETLTAKFHFVDLAGSERLKRTGATGERAKEGISINSGLLSLGNVISALGDSTKKATHIPYRDSKLTRLLQDSLGGNSQTLMIACVSPSDRDFMETLNTLKYANRARNITNKVVVNQDQSSRTISLLRREIAALQMELIEYKQGKRTMDSEGNSTLTDTFHENAMLLADNKRLQQRIKAMQETINNVTEKNVDLIAEKESSEWTSSTSNDKSVTELVGRYIKEIEKLRAKLIESEQMYQQLKKTVNTARKNLITFADTEDVEDVIDLAKRKLEKEREMFMSKSLPGFPDNSTSIDNENESDSDEDSDESEEKVCQEDLIDISEDIELKSKLIEQLEMTKNRMEKMRQIYEEKLNVLNSKIINTQRERDQVLANMTASIGGTTNSTTTNDKTKKVREEYERKINDMQKELKKLQMAQREHARQHREIQAQETQLRTLKAELSELKSAKIKLIKRMNEQMSRHKEAETRKAREIAQLRKEQRKQSNAIKSLQTQSAAKDQVLKRRIEEVAALKRDRRSHLSQKAAGRLPPKKTPVIFNPKQARTKWETLQRTINRAARTKQTMFELESELERLVAERESLIKDLNAVKRRQKTEDTPELASEEDTLKSSLRFVQENITQVQHSIVEIEDGKQSTSDTQNIQNLLENIRTFDEAKFLLEKLTSSSILQTCETALTQNRLMDNEALLSDIKQESNIQHQLLQHVLTQNPSVAFPDTLITTPTISNKFSGTYTNLTALDSDGDGQRPTIDSNNTISTVNSRSPSPMLQNDPDTIPPRTPKVRRRTAQTQDLLFGDSSSSIDQMSRSYQQQHSPSHQQQQQTDMTRSSFIPLSRVPSAPGSLKDDDQQTPPSPLIYRRMTSREDTATDVFSRLGAGTQDPVPGGSIREYSGKIKPSNPLNCTHVVEGHSNSVLAVKVNDNNLYTAAADRTVRIWDLGKSNGPTGLLSHAGPVVAVEHDRKTNLLFSACGAFVRVWDLRSSHTKSVKTLCSSGNTMSGTANLGLSTTGESPVTALSLGSTGNLYIAASDKVRIWDLRNFSCVGKLIGGHQAAVMCVASWKGPDGTDFVATGSKDHYVKVFEVSSAAGIVSPLLHLEPPHYDGVQALVVAKNSLGADAELFSGSRDTGIKRWDLRNGELKQSLNNAHKGWVSGMTISDDILLSACRGGIIRLWNVNTCESIADMKTDSAINDIVCNRQLIYTAANDGKIRVWKLRRQIMLQTR